MALNAEVSNSTYTHEFAQAHGDRYFEMHIQVREMPGSGTPEEMLHAAEVDADAIAEAVQAIVR